MACSRLCLIDCFATGPHAVFSTKPGVTLDNLKPQGCPAAKALPVKKKNYA